MRNSAQWTAATQAQIQAAERYVEIILQALRTEKGVHSETAIAAAARMAGTFLFRSFNFPLQEAEPGSAVLSNEANEHGPALIQTLGAGLGALKVELNRTRLSAGVPPGNRPQLSVNETQARIEAQMRKVSAELGLAPEQSAHACALAAARLIQLTTGVLDHHIGFAIAAHGFVEGAKTAPIPLAEDPVPGKPWWKFW